MQKKRRALPSMWGCSSLLSQHHNTDLWAFLKLMVVMIKVIQIPYLDKWSMLLSGQVSHRSNLSNLFWSLENPLLVQTLSYRGEITYDLLRLAFSTNWFQYRVLGIICCIHMKLNSYHHSKFIYQWVISYQRLKCWVAQLISICHWSKQNIGRLNQVKNEGRKAWHIIFRTYISTQFKGAVW